MELTQEEYDKRIKAAEALATQKAEQQLEEFKTQIADLNGTKKGLEIQLEKALAHTEDIIKERDDVKADLDKRLKAEREVAIDDCKKVDEEYDVEAHTTDEINAHVASIKRVLAKYNLEAHTTRGGTSTPGPDFQRSADDPIAKKYGGDTQKAKLHRKIYS